jgi:Protein of unknown function (DUF2384)
MASPSRMVRPSSPEQQAELRIKMLEMKRAHMADWIDSPLPALGGRSPREAIRTSSGRSEVDAIVRQFEYHESMLPTEERANYAFVREALKLPR